VWAVTPISVRGGALRRHGRRPFLYAGDCSPAPATYPVTFASAEAKAARTGRPITPPYLALLRAGFCLPPTLPPARCALTAPFHPYPSTRRLLAEASRSGRYFFCATVRQVTLPGRYPAHCPSEFGLSSRLRAKGATADGRLANCDTSIVACGSRFPPPATSGRFLEVMRDLVPGLITVIDHDPCRG